MPRVLVRPHRRALGARGPMLPTGSWAPLCAAHDVPRFEHYSRRAVAVCRERAEPADQPSGDRSATQAILAGTKSERRGTSPWTSVPRPPTRRSTTQSSSRQTRLRDVSIDPTTGRARAAAGTVSLEVAQAAGEHGLAALRLASPDVRGVAEHDPDLFWALCGGRGSFGIVTAIEFDLFPVRDVYAGTLFFPPARAKEILSAWRDWTRTVPDEVMSVGRMLQLPRVPDLPEPFRGMIRRRRGDPPAAPTRGSGGHSPLRRARTTSSRARTSPGPRVPCHMSPDMSFTSALVGLLALTRPRGPVGIKLRARSRWGVVHPRSTR